jgi:NAD(P)-dependent dehydrogenase (short-subunit alcohol dehydrogenase family)
MKIAITGANSGIGLRAAISLSQLGHEVVALCRSVERAEAAFIDADIRVIHLDQSKRTSVQRAAEELSAEGPLDALINNAAVFDQTQRSPVYTADGNEVVWQTNHLGPFELTARLSGALAQARSPRVLFIASKGIVTMPRIRIREQQLGDPSWYTPVKAYYHAKLAQVMTAVHLAELAVSAVQVACLRVPAVRLDAERLAAQPALLRALYAPKNRFAAAPSDIAATYRELILENDRRRPTEVYVDEHRREVPLPRYARDVENRARLWQLSSALVDDPAWHFAGVAR